MRRKKPAKKTEHAVIQPMFGNEPYPVQVHARGSAEHVGEVVRGAENAAKGTGINLRVARTSGKTAVSVFGGKPGLWEQIFKKKKGKGNKG